MDRDSNCPACNGCECAECEFRRSIADSRRVPEIAPASFRASQHGGGNSSRGSVLRLGYVPEWESHMRHERYPTGSTLLDARSPGPSMSNDLHSRRSALSIRNNDGRQLEPSRALSLFDRRTRRSSVAPSRSSAPHLPAPRSSAPQDPRHPGPTCPCNKCEDDRQDGIYPTIMADSCRRNEYVEARDDRIEA